MALLVHSAQAMGSKAIKESEEQDATEIKAAVDEWDRRIHGQIDAFEWRVADSLRTSPSPDLTCIQIKIV